MLLFVTITHVWINLTVFDVYQFRGVIKFDFVVQPDQLASTIKNKIDTHLTMLDLLNWSIQRNISLLCNWYAFSILVHTIYHWTSPGVYSPAANVLWSLNEPLLRPLRKFFGKLGVADLTPVFAIILLQVANIFLPLPDLFRAAILYL